MSKNRLGKGLGALISEKNLEEAMNEGRIKEIYIEQIEPNPYQPRQEFDQESLEELANSIKEKGLIQPVTLRQVKPDNYQLITGERRWRASRMAGLQKIPALIRSLDDQQMMETALIENLQREDLNPIEEAQAYQKMIEEFDYTQEDIAGRIGKSRSSVANILRLLNLPSRIQIYVSRETISMGHARAILGLEGTERRLKTAEYVIENRLSVRETEEYVRRLNNLDEARKTPRKRRRLSPEWLDAERILNEYLEARVRIKDKKDKKLVTIECRDYDDLERLLKKLNAS